ncbi:MAG: RsmG family class I SAM-dependent methyltransferase [Acidimicrobiales bacterium]|jgi:16S rRNA (guanine527-N7)-methyltransferase
MADAPALSELLLEARDRGYLGDQPVQRHIDHAVGFLAVCAAARSSLSPPGLLIDLGAGAGIPGLVLALSPPPGIDRVVLLEGSQRRAEWLHHTLETLALSRGVEILGERAEVAGRLSSWRASAAVVVARSFGRPAVAAECAAPFLQLNGRLIVSEPPLPVDEESSGPRTGRGAAAQQTEPSPELEARWPAAAVATLGFGPAQEWRAGGFRYAVLSMGTLCPERYPRRNGIPAKRPLF